MKLLPHEFSVTGPIRSSGKKLTQKQERQVFQNPIVIRYFMVLCCLLGLQPFLFAQDVLVGLTSKGGVSNGGTAFSLKATGADFTVHRAFANVGTNPDGDLIKGFDGNF